ncbi:MAG: ABC transporter ATP-binding protein [bacterium]|nr:ABC transporter ATP-binding protein [bacterium]
MLLAGVTSSYSFMLGYITKMTVDHVLQIRPDTVRSDNAFQGGDASVARDSGARTGEQVHRSRDPNNVLPNAFVEGDPGPKKSKAEQIKWLWVVFFIYLAVRTFFAVLNWFFNYNIAFVGQRIVFRIRLDLHQKVQKLQMTFFDRQQTGKIMSRILDDVGLLQGEVTTTFVNTTSHVARILIGTVILLTINVKLAAVSLLALPLYVITYKFFQRAISVTFSRMRETYGETYAILEERVRGVRVVYSFVRERGERRSFFQRLAEIFRLAIRNSMLNVGLGATCSTISAVASALIFYWGALMVRDGTITVGELIYFNMSLGNLFQPLVELTNVNAVIQQMMVVISRVFEVMDEEILIQDRPGAVNLKQVRGRVQFQHVWFRYNEAGDHVLKDLSFEVKAGTSVAVVGPSGAGKSTLLSLLLRLYEPTEGKVLLDDYDIRDARVSSLRRHISMVPQEPVLFSGTIAENIIYGRDRATPEQIMEAAKRAELHEYIMTLPEKYESRVEERGSNLSGGQKQRLAFSMALLTDPSILVLDDTTSALDAKTEARIQKTLDHIMEGRTTFVITHRISTAMRADRILVLDAGRMVGWGTHAELVQQEAVCRQFYEQQQAGGVGLEEEEDAEVVPTA